MPAPFTVGLAALFGGELPDPGGMKAEVGGEGGCKEDAAWLAE